MSNPQVISAIIAVAGVALGLFLRYYKGGIGEREVVDNTIDEGRLNIARGTVEFASDTAARFTRLADEMASQRSELEDVRNTCSDLHTRVDDLQRKLAAVTDERDELAKANRKLRDRVDAQDEEIRQLRQRVEDLQRSRGPAGRQGQRGPEGVEGREGPTGPSG